MSCGGGSQSAPRSSGSVVPGVPELTSGERCVLAASEVGVCACSALRGAGLDSAHGGSSTSDMVPAPAFSSASSSSSSLTGWPSSLGQSRASSSSALHVSARKVSHSSSESSSGVADAFVLVAGERCVLAASWGVDGDDDDGDDGGV